VNFPKVSSPPTVIPFAETHLFDSLPVVGAVLGAQTPLTLAGAGDRAVDRLSAQSNTGGLGGAHGGRESCGGGSARHQRDRRADRRDRRRQRTHGDCRCVSLTLSAFNAFFFNMVNGRGWICVALVVFASWRPGKALVGAILFAAFDALQLRLQQSSGGVLPYQVYLMLPVRTVHPGARAGGAQGGVSSGADETLPQG
jgi:simple sugar transport system permease protein